MSRVKIGAVVGAVVFGLTLIAYLVAVKSLEGGIRRDLDDRVSRAQSLLTQISSLESFDTIARAQSLARDPAVAAALDATDPAARDAAGREAFARFQPAGSAAPKPDFLAVLDGNGAVAVTDSPLPDSDGLKARFKAVAAALERGQVSKDVWNYGKNTVRVGVAPVLGAGGAPRGAAIVAYALNSKEAQAHAQMLGTELVFFSAGRVVATSFPRQVVDDLAKFPALEALANEAISGKSPAPALVDVGDDEYIATAVPLPLNFEDRTSGALVMGSLSRAQGELTTVKVLIWALGAGALIIALLTMLVTSRMILNQADEIEVGVAEIINGDVDYTFKPVGADLDGLANGLNVMLARLLGRPEPGEEGEALEEGAPARVMLEEIEGQAGAAGARMSNDPDVVALAREPEADYYKRTFDEYMAARKAVGESVEGVSFESFSAKLRLNEANLKKKYNCKAVRFRVQTKGDQVSLKPVPIL